MAWSGRPGDAQQNSQGRYFDQNVNDPSRQQGSHEGFYGNWYGSSESGDTQGQYFDQNINKPDDSQSQSGAQSGNYEQFSEQEAAGSAEDQEKDASNGVGSQQSSDTSQQEETNQELLAVVQNADLATVIQHIKKGTPVTQAIIDAGQNGDEEIFHILKAAKDADEQAYERITSSRGKGAVMRYMMKTRGHNPFQDLHNK